MPIAWLLAIVRTAARRSSTGKCVFASHHRSPTTQPPILPLILPKAPLITRSALGGIMGVSPVETGYVMLRALVMQPYRRAARVSPVEIQGLNAPGELLLQ